MRACPVVVLMCLASAAQAQTSFSTELFRPSPHGEAFFGVESGAIMPSVGVQAGVFLDFATNTLVAQRTSGSTLGLVQQRLDAHLLASLSLWDHLSIGLAFPITLVQTGYFRDLTGAGPRETNTSAGDLRIEPKVGILDEKRHWLDLAVLLSLSVPTGNERAFAGDRSITLGAEVDLSRHFGPTRIALNLGYLYRQPTTLFGVVIGQELYARAAFAFDFRRTALRLPLEIIVELFARTQALHPYGAAGVNPAEAILGVKWRVLQSLALSAGVGRGLVGGYGSPAFRVFAGLVWTWEKSHAVDPMPVVTPTPVVQTKTTAETQPTAAPKPAIAPTFAPEPPPPVVQPEPELPPSPVPAAPAEKNEMVPTKIYFDHQQESIAARSLPSITALARYLVKHREIGKVCIEGHTDDTGSEAYNLELSKKRAQAVVDALVQQGVDSSRLEASGRGLSRPVVPGRTLRAREINRRVVLKLCP